MRILIVDDEALARAFLAEQLRDLPGMQVVGEAANGFEAVKLAEEHRPELLLLDVQMPKLSGLEVMELLGEQGPAVIFVTAHDAFALKAFDLHAVDYLLKPVEPARLKQALERASNRLQARTQGPSPAAVAAAARPPAQPLERVVIREGTQVHLLKTQDIDYIVAQDDYLCFAAGERRLRKQQTLAQLEAQLDPACFVRIHRSFMLNVQRIARIEPYGKDSWMVMLSSGGHLPLSRAGYQRLKAVLD